MTDGRLRHLNGEEPNADGRYVLYWMQQAQRAGSNHALAHAIERADERGQPVVVGYGIMDDYPDANLRHYHFMLEGLADVKTALDRRRIPFVLRRGSPEKVAVELAQQASIIVCDKGYTRHQRAWRDHVAKHAGRLAVEVESDVVVPVELASGKAETAARTIRPKIMRLRDRFLEDARDARLGSAALKDVPASDLDPRDIEACLRSLTRLDRSVGVVGSFKGGQTEGRKRLESFLGRLGSYGAGRGTPGAQAGSHLSPYLHFGQISPVELALAARDAGTGGPEDKASFLEELVVRRELACNFVWYTEDYDSFDGLPNWARTTLSEHAADRRDHVYTQRQLEDCSTHDRYWNAAMREMIKTGYMHNHMRMYWGKKILEWSKTPRTGYEMALALNNKWFLDGRDCNSFTNVGWCFGLHDRGWTERPIFGKVRYMNDRGLERKFDMQAYIDFTDELPG